MYISTFGIAHFAGKIADWFGTTGLRLVVILVGAWLLRRILVKVVSSLLKRAMHIEQTFITDLDREKRMDTFIALINAVLSVLVWIIAGMLVLQEFGIKPGPLMTGAGVLGVGLAFGTQALVKDFVSGLFIVLENQYRVGDDVELDATKGIVEHVGIRTTVLRDEDGNIHFIPNGLIQRTTNKSLGFSPLAFSLTVSSEVDDELVKQMINRTGEKMRTEKKWIPHFIQPLSYIGTGETTDKKVEYLVQGKVKTAYRSQIAAEFRKRLLDKLEHKNIKSVKLKETLLEKETTDDKGKK
ncbi:MAG TPA: mechanosensitive ion channel family protein [Candidatus Saccharimonadales bacterium]|nr:mechanosensitive ion channel family protein [Candidatus Saccharimonadales bacterium]